MKQLFSTLKKAAFDALQFAGLVAVSGIIPHVSACREGHLYINGGALPLTSDRTSRQARKLRTAQPAPVRRGPMGRSL